MIPIRVFRNDNELNECAHCGREYALDDTPAVCIEDCPGYDRKGEPVSWQIEQWAIHLGNLALENGASGEDITTATNCLIELAKQTGEYTLAHMENAMMLAEHLCCHRIEDRLLEKLGGSAGLREHLAAVAVQIEKQFTGIGLEWDKDGDWYTLCDRVAEAIQLHPTISAEQIVRDVMNAELKIVFRPELATPEMQVRQTSCKHCNQDIEAFSPYPAGQWRDRGNNTTCPAPVTDGRQHEPV